MITLTWNKHRNYPIFATTDGTTPHGGNCDFVIRKHKRGVRVEDCRDAVTPEGVKNHWWSEWLGGFKGRKEAKKFCELLANGTDYKTALRATNPGLAKHYDFEVENGWENPSWNTHDPTKKVEHDVDACEKVVRDALNGNTPTVKELRNFCVKKFGCTGRTTRLVHKLEKRIPCRGDAF